MSNYNSEPISQLPSDSIVLGTDLYAAVDTTDFTSSPSGTTKKYYVSSLLEYIQSQETTSCIQSVSAASTENLQSNYWNGSNNDGIGATLTNTGIYAPFSVDSVSFNVGDRVLVWVQSDAVQNGIYIVSVLGDSGSPWVLTRASDYDDSFPNQINTGDFVGVTFGALYAMTFFFMLSPTPLSVGFSPINFNYNSASFQSPWIFVSSSSQDIFGNNKYVITSPGLCTLNLPTYISQGDTIQIQGVGPGLFQVNQNAGQQIIFGSFSTTIGPSGYLAATIPQNSLSLLCIQNNTTFIVMSPFGEIDYD